MVKLFRIDNRIFNDDALFEKYLSLADGRRREKVGALLNRQDKNASLAAGAILPAALGYCGISGGVELTYGPFGKPLLVSPGGISFNISHSGDYVLLALSQREVGVDVQRATSVDLRVAKRFFTPEEYQAVVNSETPRETFFRLWTVKESYLKAVGAGLTRPLNSFGVVFSREGAVLQGVADGGRWRIREYNFPGGYFSACCAEEDEFEDRICDLRLK